MKNCLVVLYSPEETGAPEFMLRVRKYENGAQALDAYANTMCYDSELCTEETAQLCISMESELIHSIQSGMSLIEAMQDWDLIV